MEEWDKFTTDNYSQDHNQNESKLVKKQTPKMHLQLSTVKNERLWEKKKVLTLIQDSKLFPYLFSKASLISPKSISDRLTIMRIKVLSFVPIPAIELWRRSAK